MNTTASFIGDAQTGPVLQSSVSETRAYVSGAVKAPGTFRLYGECLRGFLAGLCLQGALALCFYGMYVFGHMAR